MKKVLTLRNIVVWAGALLLLVAFFMSFGAKMSANVDGYQYSYNGIVWGAKTVTMMGKTVPISSMGEGINKLEPAALLLVGFILMLVAALAAVLIGLFVNKPWAKWVVLACAVVALAGAVMQFFAKDSFANAYVNTIGKALGMSKEEIKEAIKEFRAQEDQFGAKFVINTVGGVLGLLGALAVGASQFLPEKK